MDIVDESDEEGPRLLKKKQMLGKVDENIDFKKLQCRMGMIFGTTQKFGDVIAKYAITQCHDLKISVPNSNMKRVAIVCKESCKFWIYAF